MCMCKPELLVSERESGVSRTCISVYMCEVFMEWFQDLLSSPHL